MAMQFQQPTKIEWFVIVCVLALLIALLVPTPKAAWDGEYPLTITIVDEGNIDRESLFVATCWTEATAQKALDQLGVYEHGFRPPEFNERGQAVIKVPVSGRPQLSGQPATYNQPKFVVVEYHAAGNLNPSPTRKRFDIPPGRGPRAMTIDLR